MKLQVTSLIDMFFLITFANVILGLHVPFSFSRLESTRNSLFLIDALIAHLCT